MLDRELSSLPRKAACSAYDKKSVFEIRDMNMCYVTLALLGPGFGNTSPTKAERLRSG